MSKFAILWWTLLWSPATEGSRNSRILITEGDPRAVTFYEGPRNIYHPGKPLPSLILKSKRNIGTRNPYEHLEYQKPVWDEDDKLQQFKLDCYSGQSCSQSIPIDFSNDFEYEKPTPSSRPTFEYSSNEILSDDETFSHPKQNEIRPKDPESLRVPATQAPVKHTMGPSVASIFGSHGLGPQYPRTNRPTVTRTPSTSSRYDIVTTTSRPVSEPRTILGLPKSNGLTVYDPFVYQHENLKRLSTDHSHPYYEEQAPPVYHSLYTDSRIFSSDNPPSYSYKESVLQQNQQKYQRPMPIIEKETMRDSLTWKKPSLNQGSFSNHDNYGNEQNSARTRATIFQQGSNPFQPNGLGNYPVHLRENPKRSSPPYFPGQKSESFPNFYSSNNQQESVQSNHPGRNYFPDSDEFDFKSGLKDDLYDDYNPDSRPWNSNSDNKNKYVGDVALLNTEIIVGEADEDLLYKWPPTSHGQRKPHSHHFKDDDDSWLKPVDPYAKENVPNVTPWTSIDSAKPQWQETSFSTTPPPSTTTETWKDPYGKWVGGDMKLTSIPFSRSADGSKRKWGVLSKLENGKTKLRKSRGRRQKQTVSKTQDEKKDFKK